MTKITCLHDISGLEIDAYCASLTLLVRLVWLVAQMLEEAYMKILGMGIPELVIILAVILLIFGPKNLPKLGSALGKTVKNLREGLGGDKVDNVDLAEEDEEEEVAKKSEALPESAPKKKVAAKKTTSEKASQSA